MCCKNCGTVVLEKVPGASLVYCCNTGSFKTTGILPVFSEASYSSWRRWARLLLHYLRSNAGNSSGHPEEFCEIVFIASMMSSLVILMYDSVFACGCPKKSFGYLIVIVLCPEC